MTAPRYTTNGHRVLLDGRTFCSAIDERAAMLAAQGLNLVDPGPIGHCALCMQEPEVLNVLDLCTDPRCPFPRLRPLDANGATGARSSTDSTGASDGR